MRRLLRLRTCIRLVAAVAITLIALGWMCRRHAEYGLWHPGNARSILYIDPELAAHGYQCYGSEDCISSDFFVDRNPTIDPFGWDVIKETRSPAWAFDAAQRGSITAGRSEIGWPLRYARIEFQEAEPVNPQALPKAFFSDAPETVTSVAGFIEIGPVSFATRPLLPGCLLFVAVVYGLVLAGEQSVWIPRRIRAANRRRRSCCVGCGYDLAGIENLTCPECGTKFSEAPRESLS